MADETKRAMLDKEIKGLNDELKKLEYKLGELLNLDCSFGTCTFDPEIDNIKDKMIETEEKKKLLEFIRKNLDSYKAG